MRIPAVVAAALLVGALAGCSEETQAKPLPPLPSGTPSVAATPSPPPEALAEDEVGAEAFARHYVELIADAYARGDTTDLEAASADGCEGCESIIRAVNEVAGRGEKRRGGGYSVLDVAVPTVTNGDVVLLLSYTRSAAEFVDANGAVQATTPPVSRTDAQMRLVRRGSGWVVQGYRVLGA